MLTRVVGECWHFLVRDVLALGYREDDILTTLTLRDMVSIVVGATPTSSVRYFLDGGWSRTDHLLANMQEMGAGVAKLPAGGYPRPGLDDRVHEQKGFFQADALPWEEAERRDAKRYSGEFKPAGPVRSRALSASRSVNAANGVAS
jgi:hypothetical protein